MSRWRTGAWIGFGLVAYVVFLAAGLPATVVWDQLQRHVVLPAELHVGGLRGTIWQGEAEHVGAYGFYAERVSWQLSPSGLLSHGGLEVELAAALPDGFAEGRLQLTPRQVNIVELQGRLPAAPWGSPITEWVSQEVALGGDFAFFVPHWELGYDGRLIAGEGRLAWHDAAVAVDHRVALGGLSSTVEVAAGGVVGTLSDTGGPLVLTGEWQLSAQGEYTLDALADTREGAAESLTRTLGMLGPRGEEGVRLGFEGRL
ncbi:hypothetical protein CKO15_02595 [Halorhodospira abdelmalekii]|uniref:type II secretion system protein N n=1 Tax=Halorhodospira abdelmalekii TaxID=421629 RepID=UPI00190502E8|nr:type II secretion system protein N [Halorhodospira abdelmalekii]MBK1734188.1 hypothetical protein [Halorhodospira abdelmalekii]